VAGDLGSGRAARRVGEAPGLGQIRLAAVTGYGQDEDRARARAAGFDVHLVKPVDRDHFKAVLEGLGGSIAARS